MQYDRQNRNKQLIVNKCASRPTD
uniref:Uncharacterized protein n=1 Tax=Anguilla anguilla TaxID=7936 RepID=A0A0E9SJA1_ANGAN